MATASPSELVVVATERDVGLLRLLTALGASFRSCLPEDTNASTPIGAEHRALILPEEHLIAVSKSGGPGGAKLRDVLSSYHYVLVWPFAATPEGVQVLSELIEARIRPTSVSCDGLEYVVHGSREMCGVLSGLTFGPVNRACDRPLVTDTSGNEIECIVSAGGDGLFIRFRVGASEIFVNSCAEAFDTTDEYCRNLSAAECFSKLIPLMFFLRHGGIAIPQVAHHWANWIIDDPNLQSHYGFLHTRDLADCVSCTGAAVTIGFIPWNHRRTNPDVVNLFRARWPRLSICVHGCDHTRSEFATATASDALQLAALAKHRMHDLESKTSLRCEKVMVFPQGKFSRTAMCALRQSDLIGAVNTELVDSRTRQGVKGGELLQPAITSYGGFPLFVRRPAEEPLANFALDLFLGKPCLIVTHHEYFKPGMQPLARMVESLNRLDPAMMWTNLENGISTTYSTRRNKDGSTDVRLYGTRAEVRLDLTADRLFVAKSEPTAAQDVHALWNGEEISGVRQNGDFTFAREASGNEPFRLEILPIPSTTPSLPVRNAKQRVKIAARRYLSEFRDNYIDRSPRIKAGITFTRSILGRRT